MSRSRLRSFVVGADSGRGVGDEAAQTREVFEVTLRTADVIASSRACTYALGSDHVDFETVTNDLVAVPIDVDMGGVELPPLGLQQRRHGAGGTGRASPHPRDRAVGLPPLSDLRDARQRRYASPM